MTSNKTIRVRCKRCDKWYTEEVDIDAFEPSQVGVLSVAFDHGDHVLTVFIDENLNVRGETLADKVGNDDESSRKRVLEYFDRY